MGEGADDWVEADGELLAVACFTAAVGATVDDVVRGFGADLATERTATFEASFNELAGSTPQVVDELDGAVLAAENNGWLGARSEVVEASSRGGRAASVYWSVNADMSFLYAADGGRRRVVRPGPDRAPLVGLGPGLDPGPGPGSPVRRGSPQERLARPARTPHRGARRARAGSSDPIAASTCPTPRARRSRSSSSRPSFAGAPRVVAEPPRPCVGSAGSAACGAVRIPG